MLDIDAIPISTSEDQSAREAICRAFAAVKDVADTDAVATAISSTVKAIAAISSAPNRDAITEWALIQFRKPGKKEEPRAYISSPASFKKQLKDAVLQRQAETGQGPHTTNDYVPASVRNEYQLYGFFEDGGRYYTLNDKNKTEHFTNFTMRVKYFVRTDRQDAFRIIEVTNIYGRKEEIELNTDDMSAVGAFKKALLRRGNFIFGGTDAELIKLQTRFFMDEKESVKLEVLGHHKKNVWAWANGIYDYGTSTFHPVDDSGIVEVGGTTFFIAATTPQHRTDRNYENQRKFIYNCQHPATPTTFESWWPQYTASFGTNGLHAFVFAAMAMHSHIVYKAMFNRFPLLFLFGGPGTGKGTLAEHLLCLFGERQNQFMLGGKGTDVAFVRTFAQFSNAIVWADEFKNSIDLKKKEFIKNVYDRQGQSRGSRDHTFNTDSVPVTSACIVSGQQMPTSEAAMFERFILLSFPKLNISEGMRSSIQQLKEMEAQGLTPITHRLLSLHNAFAEKYFETLKLEKEHSRNHHPTITQRMADAVACMTATYQLLTDGGFDMGHTVEEYRAMVGTLMEYNSRILGSNDNIARWWQVLEELVNEGRIIDGAEYHIDRGTLYLRMQHTHSKYQMQMLQQRDAEVLDRATLTDYFKNVPGLLVNNQEAKHRFPDGLHSHCLQFDYGVLCNMFNQGEAMLVSKYELDGKLKSIVDTEATQVGTEVAKTATPYPPLPPKQKKIDYSQQQEPPVEEDTPF